MIYSADTNEEFGYEKALRLIKELDKWERNIIAQITPGGVAIHPKDDKQERIMLNVCEKFGVIPSKGLWDA